MNDTLKRLNQIKMENYIWIIYLGIIALSYYSNYLEKDYFLYNNYSSKEKYRHINVFIFSILIIVYTYFEKDALESIINPSNDLKKRYFDNLVFVASSCVLISGIIFLYVVLEDDDLIEEISFN